MNAIFTEVNIQNFRSIKSQNIKFNVRNIIVGKNNSGKSNLITAINYSLSFLTIEKEDVYSSKDDPYDENKEVIIDILLRPFSESSIQKEFNDQWASVLGDAIQFDSEGKAYVGIRSISKFDKDKNRYNHKKFFINIWSSDINKTTVTNTFSREIFDNIVAIYLDAQRDISKDILDRKSLWSRLTADIKIENENKELIEGQIKLINSSLIEKSETLKRIKDELGNSASESKNTIELDSITRDIESLYKGMNIYYSGDNQSPISVEKVGLGIRSWAVFSTIKALNSINYEKSVELDEALLSVVLIEEPEAHIHPQAQRKLIKNILEMKGQIFITTHSNYIFYDINFEDILYVQMSDGQSKFSRIDFKGLSINDKELLSIKRNFMKSNADLLYCSCVVLIEGETEEYALPVYFKKYFGKDDFEFGVNFVSVKGNGERYAPYVNVLETLNIPWYIFSDGEKIVVNALNKKLKELKKPGKDKYQDFENVFVIPNNQSYEEYLINEGYSKEVKKAINDFEFNKYRKDKDFLSYYMRIHDGLPKSKTEVRDYSVKNGEQLALIDILCGNKLKYSEYVADKIASKGLPTLIKELFDLVKGKIGG